MLSIFTSEKDFDLKFLNNSDNPGWNYSDENYSTDKLLEVLKRNIF